MGGVAEMRCEESGEREREGRGWRGGIGGVTANDRRLATGHKLSPGQRLLTPHVKDRQSFIRYYTAPSKPAKQPLGARLHADPGRT